MWNVMREASKSCHLAAHTSPGLAPVSAAMSNRRWFRRELRDAASRSWASCWSSSKVAPRMLRRAPTPSRKRRAPRERGVLQLVAQPPPIAQVAEDPADRRGGELDQGGRDHDAVVQAPLRLPQDVDDLELTTTG